MSKLEKIDLEAFTIASPYLAKRPCGPQITAGAPTDEAPC